MRELIGRVPWFIGGFFVLMGGILYPLSRMEKRHSCYCLNLPLNRPSDIKSRNYNKEEETSGAAKYLSLSRSSVRERKNVYRERDDIVGPEFQEDRPSEYSPSST